MKGIKLILFLSLSIILLFGCGSETEKLENVQQEESVKENIQQQEIQQEENTKTESEIETAQVKEKEKTEGTEKSLNRNTFDAEVVSVTDGDTIKVRINGQVESVRFLLVDTPETNHPRLGEQPFGQEAKDFTKKMLEGKTVQLEKDVSDRDKYGRLLYYLYVDGKSVQEELLRNGLARVAYVYAPNTKYVDQYYEIQKEAQRKGIGIWSIENYAQEDGFHKEIVEGKQEQTSNSNSNKNSSTNNADCNIKGNISSSGEKIYHMPGQQFYDRTQIDLSKGEKYFCTPQEAQQAGFRPSQR